MAGTARVRRSGGASACVGVGGDGAWDFGLVVVTPSISRFHVGSDPDPPPDIDTTLTATSIYKKSVTLLLSCSHNSPRRPRRFHRRSSLACPAGPPSREDALSMSLSTPAPGGGPGPALPAPPAPSLYGEDDGDNDFSPLRVALADFCALHLPCS